MYLQKNAYDMKREKLAKTVDIFNYPTLTPEEDSKLLPSIDPPYFKVIVNGICTCKWLSFS